MWYHYYKNYEKIKQYSLKHNIVFDIILNYRADINSNDGIIELQKPENNEIYIPDGDDWGGINALIAYGNPEIMSIYCNIVNDLEQLCKDGIIFHPETLLKAYLEKNKINVKRFKYDIIRNNSRLNNNIQFKYK